MTGGHGRASSTEAVTQHFNRVPVPPERLISLCCLRVFGRAKNKMDTEQINGRRVTRTSGDSTGEFLDHFPAEVWGDAHVLLVGWVEGTAAGLWEEEG